MAPTQTHSPFFFLVFSLFLIPISTSLLHQNEIHHLFDVSSSIQRTRQIFSPKDLQEITPSPSNSSVLSFSLRPRASVIKPQFKNYSALTLSRLSRDSARVNSINSNLNFALSGYTHSDLHPQQTPILPEDFESPLTSGTSQGSGEYFARIGLGQPAKDYYMVIDTGSDLSWIQCKPCSDCYQQTDPIFDPSSSSSYRRLPCSSEECSALQIPGCSGGTCLYQVSYGDGSYTAGDLASETVTFGNSGALSNVPIGCGHDNEGLFRGAAGLIGLARAPLSLPSWIKATSFSYCMVDRDSSSSSTLEFNSAPPGDSVIASMVTNPKHDLFYYVDLVGISVGGQKLPIPESVFQVDGTGRGGIIIDSGTAVTRLNTQAYNSLRDSFVKYTSHLRATSGISLFDTCYDLSSLSSVKVPTVSFLFASGQTLSLKPDNYLVPIDGMGTYCFAFAPTDGSPSIIGNVQQQGTRVSFDLAKRQLGFSPNKC